MYNSVGKALTGVLMLLLSGPLAAGLDEVVVLIEAGKHQLALEKLAAQSESRRTRLLRANALSGLKRSEEAEAIYHALIDESPQDPTPYNNLAALYASAGRLQEASELLSQAMKSDDRYAAIYKNLSRVYVEMSRNSYAKALRLSEQQQGLVLLSLDHRDAPAESLQLAAVVSPQQPPAPQALPAAFVEKAPLKVAPQLTTHESTVNTASQSFDAGGGIAALKQWAMAWSAQDVEGYLAAYDADYLPPRGLSLSQWQAQRRVRLRKPNRIEVNLSDFEVTSSGGGTLTVKVVQRYRSDHYRDSTRKGFILVSRDGVWKIGDEYTIEVIN